MLILIIRRGLFANFGCRGGGPPIGGRGFPNIAGPGHGIILVDFLGSAAAFKFAKRLHSYVILLTWYYAVQVN